MPEVIELDSDSQTSDASASSPESSSNEKATKEWSVKYHKQQLVSLFDKISTKSAGTYSTSKELLNAPSPGLFVHGHGLVGLPLMAPVADSLITLCHRLPLGKGSETTVDTKVRKIWELNASEYENRNPR